MHSPASIGSPPGHFLPVSSQRARSLPAPSPTVPPPTPTLLLCRGLRPTPHARTRLSLDSTLLDSWSTSSPEPQPTTPQILCLKEGIWFTTGKGDRTDTKRQHLQALLLLYTPIDS
ncbi:hypothetical protein CF336_g8325 [Tilletia laevis]|nr:hypothetical protein CF336_g8325 [Tilletia laevis]